ncbi:MULTISPECIES: DUF3560 domain-containing protein [unclassified Cryobacterium]|uniref:DUF3560 domain-containing protein n=1 Tax=unclassified Cryobacterium TaxID=2649013 RepID=UPI002AB4EC66|nr:MULTISPECIES: DUF3560 domain-containing protein [unclassified Cryobacterium]MDY7530033.1 DUF3560 domain-containing protein [Cryobacterium sp. 10C2]MDY7555319.1 DUF3560 domain-containing protein [Cryobacterium sp. 10C3]MEB0290588.1 DUF3560 domain-containing protein [Cryobacterium sp. 10C2]
MLTITHTHEAGTLIAGTSRGDGTADVLKINGWRWGRSIRAWFVPQSRDRLPKLHTITRTKSALEAAGFEVETDIDSSHRPTAEVEAGKIERQADRVDALAAKAERKSGAEDAAWNNARAALDRLPEGGEPIKVGHHSEGRHRNAIATADNAMRKSVEASEDATTAQARADAATHTTDARYSPVTVANRIQTLGAELRQLERRITAPCYDDTRGCLDATAEQMTARAARLAPHIEEKRDQIAYWEAVRAAQVESGTATGYDRSTVRKGDRVKIRGQWREVVRTNAKTVSVTTGYTWTDTAPYAEIQQLVQPE